MAGQFPVGTAGPEAPPRGRHCRRAGTEHAPGRQLVEVGQTLPGKSIEQVYLGGSPCGYLLR